MKINGKSYIEVLNFSRKNKLYRIQELLTNISASNNMSSIKLK
jgi:hypothetical protein